MFKHIDVEKLNTIILGRTVYNLFEYAETQKEFSENIYENFDKIILAGREELLREIINDYNRELKLLEEGVQVLNK